MSLTVLRFCVIFACVSCARNLREGIAKLTPAVPGDPRTDTDTLLSLAISRAAVHEKAVPDYGLLPDHRTVILLQDSLVGSRALPPSDSVRFVLMSREEIQRFADRYGPFVYLSAGVALGFRGDSALAGASTVWATPRHGSGTVLLSGGGCSWLYVKQDSSWRFARSLGCIIS